MNLIFTHWPRSYQTWFGTSMTSGILKRRITLGLQIIRSADSIAANIAEGYGRYTSKDRKRFYMYSRGSFEETKWWLRKEIRRKIINKKSVEKYKTIIDELGLKLNAFIKNT